MVLFWLALAVSIVVSVGAMIFLVVRGLELFRDFKRVSTAAGERLDEISRTSAEIEVHLEAAATSGTALEASLERLRRSRAELAVLLEAFADVRASVDRVIAFVPRSK